MMKLLIFLFVFLFALSGCNQLPQSKHKIDYQSVPCKREKNIMITSLLQLDTLKISGEKMSMEGDFYIHLDTLYFADRILASVLVYDKEGKYITSKLKKGRGPEEILGLNKMTILPDGDFVLMDPFWNITICNKNWGKVKNFRMKWETEQKFEQLVKCPDPNDIGIYEVEYAKNRIRSYDDTHLVFPIVTEAKNLNAYEGPNTRHFYNETYSLATLSLQSGKVERLFCNYSPVYQKYTYLPNFKNPIFDTHKDQLYFSFQADPLIYQMNIRDSSIISFGQEGYGMNTDYRETSTLADADSGARQDIQNFGHYRYLNYCKETGYLFRGYRKGKAPQPDGLQIYRGNCLIADVEVDREFEVIGYIEPWFYARGANDYENEEVVLYRFKLNCDE